MVIPLYPHIVAASPFQHHLTLPILGLFASFCHPFDSQNATINKLADFSVIMFAVKRALKLNNREATLMAKHAGFRRVVYNFGLSLRTQMYGETKCGDSKIIDTIKKILTNHVKKRPEFSWMNQMSSRVYQHALKDLKTAFSRYRKGVARHPVYASRRDGQSFTVDNGGGKSNVTEIRG